MRKFHWLIFSLAISGCAEFPPDEDAGSDAGSDAATCGTLGAECCIVANEYACEDGLTCDANRCVVTE